MVGVRHRPQRLRDHPPGDHAHGDLAGARPEQRPGHLQEIAQVDEVEVGEVGECVAAEVHLDAAAGIAQIQERGLAHDALGGDAPDDRHAQPVERVGRLRQRGDRRRGLLRATTLDLERLVGGDGVRGGVRARHPRGVGVPLREESLPLVEALGDEFLFGRHGSQ